MENYTVPTRHRLFVSFHHADEAYRQEFDRLFGDSFLSSSVDFGDIDPANNDEYIKRLIQQEHVVNSSVVVALYGAGTHKRKHVDWEISAALSKKVGDHKGLIVMLLPTFPVAPYNAQGQYDPSIIYPYLHPRTAANLQSGYADLYFWPGMYAQYGPNTIPMQTIIETAFGKRETHEHLIDHRHPQYINNLA